MLACHAGEVEVIKAALASPAAIDWDFKDKVVEDL
jgi:hypothetical protein